MADEGINIQAVIDQLMTRIAQLELEVAILKSMTPSSKLDSEKPESKPPGGYM